ncbi:hypothetical protein SAMN05444271_13820 [Halohasta litchfieldiae]|uniref:Uncharacterized protein n=1 Tax=Halohasta litchfieldiae TaxID=1073996 RepID=A0A1H6XR58_9EURY|nr:hypothetical protein SAMN05444271_13820 [Halohasta litchfieldiae]
MIATNDLTFVYFTSIGTKRTADMVVYQAFYINLTTDIVV